MCSNEKNLNAFYRALGNAECISLTKGDRFTGVSGKNGHWPRMLFDIRLSKNPVEQLNEILTRSMNINGIGTAICNREYFSLTGQEEFRKYGIFPVEMWPLMEINAVEELCFKIDNNLVIRKLEDQGEIEEFSSTVNDELFRGQDVTSDLFSELLKQPGMDFYGVCNNGNMAGGLVSYTGTNNTAGLYFIVVQKEFRGKGIASALIGNVVRELFKRAVKKVVLQALPKAVPLYQKLGFKKQGELIIFRKL